MDRATRSPSGEKAGGRGTLKLRPPTGATGKREESAEGEYEQLLLAALRDGRCVQAVYNRGLVLLEPRALLRERGALLLIATTRLRDGRAPRELKLGVFRASGLDRLEISACRVSPVALGTTLPDRPGATLIATSP